MVVPKAIFRIVKSLNRVVKICEVVAGCYYWYVNIDVKNLIGAVGHAWVRVPAHGFTHVILRPSGVGIVTLHRQHIKYLIFCVVRKPQQYFVDLPWFQFLMAIKLKTENWRFNGGGVDAQPLAFIASTKLHIIADHVVCFRQQWRYYDSVLPWIEKCKGVDGLARSMGYPGWSPWSSEMLSQIPNKGVLDILVGITFFLSSIVEGSNVVGLHRQNDLIAILSNDLSG